MRVTVAKDFYWDIFILKHYTTYTVFMHSLKQNKLNLALTLATLGLCQDLHPGIYE